VKDAIDAGYRHIDGALAYGNETEVGEGIATKIKEGVVKRDDLFITSKARTIYQLEKICYHAWTYELYRSVFLSKLWNTFHRPDTVMQGIKKTLSDLGLDYLDMYLIHWPMAYIEDRELFPKDDNGQFIFSEVDYLDTWKAMEECVKLGLTKSIGVSNFNSEQISRILANCTIKPAMNQVRQYEDS